MMTVQTLRQFAVANQATIAVELNQNALVCHVRLRLNVTMVGCGAVQTNVRIQHVFYLYGL